MATEALRPSFLHTLQELVVLLRDVHVLSRPTFLAGTYGIQQAFPIAVHMSSIFCWAGTGAPPTLTFAEDPLDVLLFGMAIHAYQRGVTIESLRICERFTRKLLVPTFHAPHAPIELHVLGRPAVGLASTADALALLFSAFLSTSSSNAEPGFFSWQASQSKLV